MISILEVEDVLGLRLFARSVNAEPRTVRELHARGILGLGGRLDCDRVAAVADVDSY